MTVEEIRIDTSLLSLWCNLCKPTVTVIYYRPYILDTGRMYIEMYAMQSAIRWLTSLQPPLSIADRLLSSSASACG